MFYSVFYKFLEFCFYIYSFFFLYRIIWFFIWIIFRFISFSIIRIFIRWVINDIFSFVDFYCGRGGFFVGGGFDWFRYKVIVFRYKYMFRVVYWAIFSVFIIIEIVIRFGSVFICFLFFLWGAGRGFIRLFFIYFVYSFIVIFRFRVFRVILIYI